MIGIADNIPDQTIFTLNFTTYVGDVTHTTQKSFLALAPNLQFVEVELEEIQGDGNGFIDPGEQAIIHISVKNMGHALAPDAYMTVNYEGQGIHLDATTFPMGDINRDNDFSVDVNIDTDNDIISGTTFHLDLCAHTGAYATHYDYSFSVGVAVETFESGDFTYVKWENAGDQHWFVTDDEAHNGIHSARSGEIGNGETSTLLVYADIYTDGEINFWLKTSTEYRKDMLAFFMDGIMLDWWSGETDWTYASYNFEAGSHVFKWVYDKNLSGQAGQDCVWIDDITFPRACYITKVEEVVNPSANAVYPNPTSGSFTVELVEESNISIFNMLGQNVMSLNKVSGLQQLHLSEAGIYFVHISNANGVEVKKVVVE